MIDEKLSFSLALPAPPSFFRMLIILRVISSDITSRELQINYKLIGESTI